MANKEKLAEYNPSGFVPEPVGDMYTRGVEMLQEEFEKKGDGLLRFKPFSPGALQLEENIQQQMEQMCIDNGSQSDLDSTSHASLTTRDGSSNSAEGCPASSD
jgi:TRAP-type C4-dicarboxylate transport system substrate-binding protein